MIGSALADGGGSGGSDDGGGGGRRERCHLPPQASAVTCNLFQVQPETNRFYLTHLSSQCSCPLCLQHTDMHARIYEHTHTQRTNESPMDPTGVLLLQQHTAGVSNGPWIIIQQSTWRTVIFSCFILIIYHVGPKVILDLFLLRNLE